MSVVPRLRGAWLLRHAGLAAFWGLTSIALATEDPPRAASQAPAEVAPAKRPAALDFATTERVHELIDVLRNFEIREDQPGWTRAIRELVEIGKPALPLIAEELDHTERNQSLRALGYVLRGINDPRSIPALIRAIPRTLQPAGSDYGLLCDDPDMMKFLQGHDNDPERGGQYFTFGRPFREILPALNKLTGVKHWEMEVNFVSLSGGARQRYIQRELYQRLGEFWAEWWSKNWQIYLKAPAEAQVEFTNKSLAESRARLEAMPKPPLPTEIPTGPNVEVGGGSSDHSFSALKQFLDLDSGRNAKPPKLLAALAKSEKPIPAIDEWAAAQGVDCYGIKRKMPDGREFYVLQPVGLRVWQIDNARFDKLQEELQSDGDFDRGQPVDGPLVQRDENGDYALDRTATYLFLTREGTPGVLQIGPQVNRQYAPGIPTSPSDFVLRYRLIFELTDRSETD